MSSEESATTTNQQWNMGGKLIIKVGFISYLSKKNLKI